MTLREVWVLVYGKKLEKIGNHFSKYVFRLRGLQEDKLLEGNLVR